MIYLTSNARWMRFQKYVLPLSNAKMIKHLSISQIDSFAASLVAVSEIFGIDCEIINFNRLNGNFDFSYKHQQRGFGLPYSLTREDNEDHFDEFVLFLKYIYKIDTQNKFVKEFVATGNSNKFERVFNLLTAHDIYCALKKIKKTQDLINDFFKRIKLWNEYSHSVQYWEEENQT